MPLYEYECHKCGQVFDVLQKFSDAPLETHAACGGSVERLLSAPAFHFKGSGWYVTDYAKKNGSSGENGKDGKNGSSTKSDSASSKPSESKTETKPDTKSESKSSSSSESASKS